MRTHTNHATDGLTKMIRKLFVVVVAVISVMHEASAAPGHQGLPEDGCNVIISKLQEFLSNIADPMVLSHPLEIRIDQDYVAHVYLKMDSCTLLGVKDFAVRNCALEPASLSRGYISISIKSPKVTLNTPQYFINSTMVDHIELYGHGPGMISVDDMDITVEGSATITYPPNFSLVFDTAVLDLEMWRWTVNLEDLMPGSDLGTVFNEFFSMYGPAIFDTMENKINNSGKLLNFLNGLFPPSSQ